MGSELVSANGAQAAAGLTARQSFWEQSLELRQETASMAVAAQAAAVVKARYSMALERPRDMMVVRDRLLRAMQRPRFAETARYAKPVGGTKIRGWTIRFAEEVARALGNLLPETMVVFESRKQRIVRVTVTDLEANLAYITDVTIDKTVERRNPDGYVKVGERINKDGKTVYIVEATDDDLQNKQGAMVSKAIRNAVLRLCPADILDECLDVYHAAIEGQTKDPTAALKALLDGFGRLGISLEQVVEYVGHPLNQMSREEYEDLKALGVAIHDGETSWAAALAGRKEERASEEKAEPAAEQAAGGEEKPAAAPPKNLGDLKKREKSGKQAPAQKTMDIKVEGDDGKKHPVVDNDDTGPCEYVLDAETEEVCAKEGPKVIGIGYRCGKHQPTQE